MRSIPRNIQRILEHKMICLQAFDHSAEHLGMDPVTLAQLMRGGRMAHFIKACRLSLNLLSKRAMDSRTVRLVKELRDILAPIEEHVVDNSYFGDPT